jgi:tRNA pseudouridine55 synthase
MTDVVLNINKPQDFTSHDVVAKLRGMLNTKKIGHCGTLDPMATGVLPVCVGKATKAVEFIMGQDKEYVATFKLGFVSDTQDSTGTLMPVNHKRYSQGKLKVF